MFKARCYCNCVVIVINIDKKWVTLFFSLFRFGGTLHVDSSTDGVLASHAMVMKGEEVFSIFALDISSLFPNVLLRPNIFVAKLSSFCFPSAV